MEKHIDVVDNPIERLELLAGDDEAIAAFLDQIDVTGPRDREMLSELARTQTLADAARFSAAHRRAVAALETLGRHRERDAEPLLAPRDRDRASLARPR